MTMTSAVGIVSHAEALSQMRNRRKVPSPLTLLFSSLFFMNSPPFNSSRCTLAPHLQPRPLFQVPRRHGCAPGSYICSVFRCLAHERHSTHNPSSLASSNSSSNLTSHHSYPYSKARAMESSTDRKCGFRMRWCTLHLGWTYTLIQS